LVARAQQTMVSITCAALLKLYSTGIYACARAAAAHHHQTMFRSNREAELPMKKAERESPPGFRSVMPVDNRAVESRLWIVAKQFPICRRPRIWLRPKLNLVYCARPRRRLRERRRISSLDRHPAYLAEETRDLLSPRETALA